MPVGIFWEARTALPSDRYSAYGTVVDPQLCPERLGAACATDTHRNFKELTDDGDSVVGVETVRRIARIYGRGQVVAVRQRGTVYRLHMAAARSRYA